MLSVDQRSLVELQVFVTVVVVPVVMVKVIAVLLLGVA
jgi:hypothetical protein